MNALDCRPNKAIESTVAATVAKLQAEDFKTQWIEWKCDGCVPTRTGKLSDCFDNKGQQSSPIPAPDLSQCLGQEH